MLILMLVGVAFASTGFSPRSDEAAKTQQQVPAKGTDYKVIQEIPVTGGSMVMPGMMVKGDGSLVVYIVQLAEETLEYAAMANTTRLTNSLLEPAKQLRAKNGDTRIPVEAEATRLTMIQDLAVSPYAKGLFDGKGAVGVEGGWEWVAYSAMTVGAGAFVLVVDGKEQATGFVPVHGLTFFAGGNACAFAAGTGAREFVVRNSLKALSSFTRVTPDKDFGEVRSLAFNSLTTKVAYVARDGRKEWVMIDDQKVTPEYTRVSCNREGFEWGGPLVFAGYDAAKDVIVVGRL
jgi:hypothetical protein